MQAPSRYDKLGFKVVLEKDWLDLSLSLMMHGKSPQEIREKLKADIYSSGKRSELTTKFAVQILRAWFAPDEDLIHFRDQLLGAARKIPEARWSVLHWACLTAAYPFLLSFSTVLGRLLFLQDKTNKSLLLARLQDIYGTRETVERALYYALGTFANLGLLKRDSRNTVLTAPPKITIEDDRVGFLLWESVILATKGNRISITTICGSPAFYAFDMPDLRAAQQHKAFPDICCQQYGDEVILAIPTCNS